MSAQTWKSSLLLIAKAFLSLSQFSKVSLWPCVTQGKKVLSLPLFSSLEFSEHRFWREEEEKVLDRKGKKKCRIFRACSERKVFGWHKTSEKKLVQLLFLPPQHLGYAKPREKACQTIV